MQLLDRFDLRAESGRRVDLSFLTFADEAYRLRLEQKAMASLG